MFFTECMTWLRDHPSTDERTLSRVGKRRLLNIMSGLCLKDVQRRRKKDVILTFHVDFAAH